MCLLFQVKFSISIIHSHVWFAIMYQFNLLWYMHLLLFQLVYAFISWIRFLIEKNNYFLYYLKYFLSFSGLYILWVLSSCFAYFFCKYAIDHVLSKNENLKQWILFVGNMFWVNLLWNSISHIVLHFYTMFFNINMQRSFKKYV